MGIILVSIGLIAAITVAVSNNTLTYSGLPVFAWCAIAALLIQWVAFVPAFTLKNEKFYDLVGSLSFIAVSLLALSLTGRFDTHALMLVAMVLVWATRLGSFLFVRALRNKGDRRFDKIKHKAMRFLGVWTLQALWVVVCVAPAIGAVSASVPGAVDALVLAGAAIWLLGLLIEAVADRQKQQFRRSNGPDAFVDTGLWRLSRHPNYVGEILVWTGLTLCAAPALSGWQYVSLITPIFVYLLLARVSGVPLLEQAADKKWADDPRYQAYKANTPVLWPRLSGAGL